MKYADSAIQNMSEGVRKSVVDRSYCGSWSCEKNQLNEKDGILLNVEL